MLLEFVINNIEGILNISILLSCLFIYININKLLIIIFENKDNKELKITLWNKRLKLIFWFLFISFLLFFFYFDLLYPFSQPQYVCARFNCKKIVKFTLVLILNIISIYINVKTNGFKSWRTWFSLFSIIITVFIISIYFNETLSLAYRELVISIASSIASYIYLLYSVWANNTLVMGNNIVPHNNVEFIKKPVVETGPNYMDNSGSKSNIGSENKKPETRPGGPQSSASGSEQSDNAKLPPSPIWREIDGVTTDEILDNITGHGLTEKEINRKYLKMGVNPELRYTYNGIVMWGLKTPEQAKDYRKFVSLADYFVIDNIKNPNKKAFELPEGHKPYYYTLDRSPKNYPIGKGYNHKFPFGPGLRIGSDGIKPVRSARDYIYIDSLGDSPEQKAKRAPIVLTEEDKQKIAYVETDEEGARQNRLEAVRKQNEAKELAQRLEADRKQKLEASMSIPISQVVPAIIDSKEADKAALFALQKTRHGVLAALDSERSKLRRILIFEKGRKTDIKTHNIKVTTNSMIKNYEIMERMLNFEINKIYRNNNVTKHDTKAWIGYYLSSQEKRIAMGKGIMQFIKDTNIYEGGKVNRKKLSFRDNILICHYRDLQSSVVNLNPLNPYNMGELDEGTKNIFNYVHKLTSDLLQKQETQFYENQRNNRLWNDYLIMHSRRLTESEHTLWLHRQHWRQERINRERFPDFEAENHLVNLRFSSVMDEINARHNNVNTGYEAWDWSRNPEWWQYGEGESSRNLRPYSRESSSSVEEPPYYTPEMSAQILRSEGRTPQWVAENWTHLYKQYLNPQYKLLVDDMDSTSSENPSRPSSRASNRENVSRSSSRASNMTDID
jgi:hypothetical protein